MHFGGVAHLRDDGRRRLYFGGRISPLPSAQDLFFLMI